MFLQFRFGSIAVRTVLAIAVSTAANTATAQESAEFKLSTTQSTSPSVTDVLDSYSSAVGPDTADQEAPTAPQPPPFSGPLLERPKLTGDWFGTRTALAGKGITLDVSNTQYSQGVTSGGLEQEFRYGGRNDYFLNVDGEKVGLAKGSFITLQAETRYGEPVFATAVFDTNNTPTVSGFDTFFDNGATIFAQANLQTQFFDRPGHQGISGTYSSGTYTDLSPSAYIDPIDGLVILSTPRTGSWCLAYDFHQAL